MDEKKGLITIIIVAIAAVLIFFLSQKTFISKSENNSNDFVVIGETKTFTLESMQPFDTKGVVEISEIAEGVRISITVSNVPSPAGVYPTNIYEGTCVGLGPVLYSLNPVSGGLSNSLITTSFDELSIQLPIAINISGSNNEVDTSIVCTTVDGF